MDQIAFDSALSELLFFSKEYLVDKIRSYNSRDVKTSFDKEEIIALVRQSATGEELFHNANGATRGGMKSVGSKVAHIKEFYNFLESSGAKNFTNLGDTVFLFFKKNPLMLQRSEATQYQYYLTLTNFFRYMSELNGSNVRIPYTMRKPQNNKASKEGSEITVLDRDAFAAIEKCLDSSLHGKNSPNLADLRDALLVKLLMYGGLKLDEAISLAFRDVVVEGTEMAVMVNSEPEKKGAKSRKVPLPISKIKDTFDEYVRRTEGEAHRYLFAMKTDSKERLGASYAAQIIKKTLERCGIESTRGAQMLRDSFAVTLLSRGVSLATVQKLLGLESLQMMGVYIKMLPEEMYHPEECF